MLKVQAGMTGTPGQFHAAPYQRKGEIPKPRQAEKPITSVVEQSILEDLPNEILPAAKGLAIVVPSHQTLAILRVLVLMLTCTSRSYLTTTRRGTWRLPRVVRIVTPPDR